MAEVAPLTTAHNHVRKAAQELQKIHLREAAQEHQQASTDFARATKATSDVEALRVLKLLEEQHRTLASIIRSQDSPVPESNAQETTSTEQQPPTKDVSSTRTPAAKTEARKTKSNLTTSAIASARVGSQLRDSSPSLARDIATRRGIPQSGRTQPSPAAQARARQLSPESRRRVATGIAPKVLLSIVDSQANIQHLKRTKEAEENFYSSIRTGTMSKLSSVLAYAGLPLTTDDAVPDQNSKDIPDKPTVNSSNDPDVKKIFSKAALDAIEDEHRQRGTLGHGFGPAESFYVVPASGGMATYANVARPKSASSYMREDDDAEFVDAREAPDILSPTRSNSSQQRGSFGKPRTEEELELENTTLKQSLEDYATRLATFEAHAQDASMAALTQSMTSLKPAPASGQMGAAATQQRLQQLERQVQGQSEERQRLENHALKLEKINRKYRAKWEELQQSARQRGKMKRDGGEKAADDQVDGVAGDGQRATVEHNRHFTENND